MRRKQTSGKGLLVGILVALTAMAVPAGLAWANHVSVEINPGPHQPSSAPPVGTTPPVVTAPPAPPPAPTTTTVPVPQPQTLQADEIKAHQVRANTIYANKIEADEVQGQIHQSKGVKINGRGDIKAPEVSASVIYAETINANSVVAQDIYVRDMRRR